MKPEKDPEAQAQSMLAAAQQAIARQAMAQQAAAQQAEAQRAAIEEAAQVQGSIVRTPISKATLLAAQKTFEMVVNNAGSMYIPETGKAWIDGLTNPAPLYVQFLPGVGSKDHFWIVACGKDDEGATVIKESESKGTALIQVGVIFRFLGIKRAGTGRKERFPAEFVPNGPYGAGIKVAVQPSSNEPVDTRKKSGNQKADAAKTAGTPAPATGASNTATTTERGAGAGAQSAIAGPDAQATAAGPEAPAKAAGEADGTAQ